MIPTPAPGMMMPPVVCAVTIAKLDAKRAALVPRGIKHEYAATVVGPWAFIGWLQGDGGGQSIYRHVDGQWCMVANGGGAMDRDDVIRVAGPMYGARLWARSHPQ